jgi:hypothetical protein
MLLPWFSDDLRGGKDDERSELSAGAAMGLIFSLNSWIKKARKAQAAMSRRVCPGFASAGGVSLRSGLRRVARARHLSVLGPLRLDKSAHPEWLGNLEVRQSFSSLDRIEQFLRGRETNCKFVEIWTHLAAGTLKRRLFGKSNGNPIFQW